jgi:hypothetical protein
MDVFMITEEDLNGDLFLGSQEGETLVNVDECTILVPSDLAEECAGVPMRKREMKIEHVNLLWRLNFANQVRQKISAKEAFAISYVQAIIVHRGFTGIVDEVQLANFHVKYTDVKVIEDYRQVLTGEREKLFEDTGAQMRADFKKVMRETIIDRICLVAFVFRTRGHHWLDNYQHIYQRVWEKCRYSNDDVLMSFKCLARNALHAIFPVHLEQIWKESIDSNQCNGALAKRFNSAAAGTAGVVVVAQGLRDVLQVAPGVENKFPEDVAYLKAQDRLFRENRFVGSVNARYYGVQAQRPDEKRIGVLAAILRSLTENLASDSPIKDSPALRRIANYAPITGALIGTAAARLSGHPDLVNALVLKAPEVPR